jgi:hypothetical protein
MLVKRKTLALTLTLALLSAILSAAKAVQFDYGQFEGLPYERPPTVTVMSPSPNGTYNMQDVPLNVTIQIFGIYHNMERVKWLNYSLDGQTAIPMTLIVPSKISQLPYPVYGNDVLTSLSDGTHNLTIYGKTAVGGLAGTFNETISFTVDTSIKPIAESYTTTLVVAVTILIVAVVAVSLSVYFKKRNGSENHEKQLWKQS